MTGKEIFFMIRTGENDTFIISVDKKLKPVEADYHYYSGDTAQLLRSIDSIKEEMAFQISWDESEATDVSLSQNPHLLYQLIRRKNLIDEKGHAISVHPDTSVLQLVLKKFGRNIERILSLPPRILQMLKNMTEPRNTKPTSCTSAFCQTVSSCQTMSFIPSPLSATTISNSAILPPVSPKICWKNTSPYSSPSSKACR